MDDKRGCRWAAAKGLDPVVRHLTSKDGHRALRGACSGGRVFTGKVLTRHFLPADPPNRPSTHPTLCQVIFFAPLYDSYLPMAARAGAVPR